MNSSFHKRLEKPTGALPSQFMLSAIFFVLLTAIIGVTWFQAIKKHERITKRLSTPTESADVDLTQLNSLILDNPTLTSSPVVANSPLQTINVPPMSDSQNLTEASHTLVITVKPQDTISSIFKSNNLSEQQLQQILALNNGGRLLKNLAPKQEIELEISSTGKLMQLVFPFEGKQLVITAQNENFQEAIHAESFKKRIIHIHGNIKHSLMTSILKTGMSQKLILQFSKILSKQINFARDIHEGDQYNIIYTEYFLDDKKIQPGNILAAELTTQKGKQFTAIRFVGKNGIAKYYLPNSISLSQNQNSLRYPFRYSHISSNFTAQGRYHPILHIYRPHLGMDLAAPTGTAVKAIASGKISFVGRHGGYGKAIIIDHGHGYTTLYGHLARYPHGLHVGSAINAGQTIGFVGSTGLATGPHCHFEFRKNGIHLNPAVAKLPGMPSLSTFEKLAFKQQAKALLLELHNDNRSCSANTDTGITHLDSLNTQG
jgi:murein DD-endopeptidase MepM/ murein hydrolase activator NlpD